jgi:hypothetical protein
VLNALFVAADAASSLPTAEMPSRHGKTMWETPEMGSLPNVQPKKLS